MPAELRLPALMAAEGLGNDGIMIGGVKESGATVVAGALAASGEGAGVDKPADCEIGG